MDFLRRIEEDFKNLENEVRKKFPDVKESIDKANFTLKTIRDSYVSDVMKKSDDETKLARFKSIEIAQPYLLTCIQADSISNFKLIMMALNGLQMVLDFKILPLDEAHNVLKILIYQSSGKSEIQMKILQIGLQLANSLASDPSFQFYLNDQTIKSFFFLSLSLCDDLVLSVSSTAFVTSRQIIVILLEKIKYTSNDQSSLGETIDILNSFLGLIKDLSLVCSLSKPNWLLGNLSPFCLISIQFVFFIIIFLILIVFSILT